MSRLSLAMVLPASATTERANSALEKMGFGPGNIAIPLSPSGNAPITHVGCHWNISEEDEARIAAVIDETLVIEGMTTQEISALKKLVRSKRGPDGRGAEHFAEILGANGLKQIADPPL